MRRVMLRRSGCRQALVVTSIYLLLGGISHADIHGNDSRADPICYDTITGTTAFTRTSKAVGTFHNRGEVFDQDGNLTPNQLHLCAAFLISPENHVLTNAHCLATTATRREMQLVFGGQAVGCGSSTVTSHETYSLTENDLILELPELDMALFQISSGDPAVEDGFGWLRLDPDTRLTNIWWSPGFNEGVIGPPGGKRTIFLPTTGIEEDITDNNPKVAWDGDCEVTNVPRDCSETQDRLDAMTEGLWTSPPNACLTHACDASPGSSGAPILDTPSVKVIGINTGVTGGIGTNDGYAIKIRNIWPRINHLIDVRDSDEDGLPDVRDNCDFEPNTGSCTSGRIGFGCFVDSNCDTFLVADGSMGDGICEGSQVDFDGDGVGDICETLPPDAFEDNDLPLQAATLAAGHYNLTIDERFDEDFFSFTNTAASSPVRISAAATANQGFRELGFNLTYRDCETCPPVLAAPQEQQDTSSRGQRYAEDGVPAGRIYEIHVFSFGLLGPIAYDLTLSTDPNEPNNSVLTATDWSPPGCDFSGTLGLDGSDIDYFAFPASGSSVEVQAFFDPGRNLQVSLDGVQGSQGADFGDRETQVISGCGLEPSFVTVSGDPGAYDLCIKQVPIEDSCSLVDQFIPFAGTGYFTFQRTNPFVPGGVIEGTKPLNRHMFARLLSETGTDVTWEVLGTVEYGAGFNQLFRGEMVIPRPNPTTPFGFGPLAAGTPLLFEAVPGRVAWFQVAPVGVGEALFTGPDNAIESFDVMSQGLQWNASRPDDQATLVVQAGRDGDRDGVRDDVELETGTDPTLADTDGDGLVDGVEDANGNGLVDPGETDPRLEDTDGDGVSDGIEAGVVTPGASYAPLTSRDADPYTFTDPTTIDTDGDGRSDGVEDANGNGRQDPGETSPNVPDDFGNDPDGDGFADSADNCPAVYNPAQTDSDGDGEGDACDPADAVVNAADVFSTPGCWPACGPGDFPLDLGVIRSFVFLVPTGRQVEEVQISGTWGDVDSFDSTAPVELHLDGVMVAECLTSDPCWLEDGQFVDWSFSFRDQGIPDIAALFADGRAELTAVQNDVISVILSNLVLTVFVPEPGSTLLLTTGLLGLVGLARGRRGRGRMGRVGSADRQIKRPFPYHR